MNLRYAKREAKRDDEQPSNPIEFSIKSIRTSLIRIYLSINLSLFDRETGTPIPMMYIYVAVSRRKRAQDLLKRDVDDVERA